MAVLDRNRIWQLIELSAAERTVKGPERLVRENDVQQLIKAAWDDANQKARDDFLAQVDKKMNQWPWSAVQALSARSGVGVVEGKIAVPQPVIPPAPPLLILLRGQVDLPDVDPGNRIPDRGSPEGAAWEGLYRALDTWNTDRIKTWWSPTGWVIPDQAGGAGKNEGFDPAGRGGETSGPAAPGGSAPTSTPTTTPTPATNGENLPATNSTPWTTQRVIVVAGVTFVVTGAVVMSYMSYARSRELERYNNAMRDPEVPR